MAAKPWIITPLTLAVGTKKYVIEPIGYEDGLTLIARGDAPAEELTKDATKDSDAELFALCMGDTWQQMLDDKNPYPVMFRAGMSAIQYQMALVQGIDSAEAVKLGESMWESGIDPELMAALIKAADLSNQQKTSTRSTSSATAKKTPPRASGRTTPSQRTTPRTAAKATPARKSTGKRSPATGR